MTSFSSGAHFRADDNRRLEVVAYYWDTDALDYVISTGSTASGSQVEITNLPATYSPLALSTWVSGTVTLTNANTAYKIPSSEQSGRRTLILYNGSDTDMIWGASTITTSGILLTTGLSVAIDASANIYAACASAGKVLTYLEGK